MPSWTYAAVLPLLVLLPLIPAQRPSPDDAVAAIFPPWWSAASSFRAAAAAGRPLALGVRSYVVVVAADPFPGLATRLRAEGAWAVLSTRGGLGCLATQ